MLLMILGLSFLVSALLTAWVRHYGIEHKVMDIPNSRSSHTVATPTGGGASIVLTFMVAVLLLGSRNLVAPNVAAALLGGGLLVALVGLLDDHTPLPTYIRVATHSTAAGWSLWCLGGMQPLYLGWITWEWGWLGHILALVGLVWLINLYNFMDGIDGLAGVETICVGAFGGVLLAIQGAWDLASVAWTLASSCAGFLVWNWPPAKIFMGDVGSGFLGFVFGVLAVASAKHQPWHIWPWLILLCVFVADSTLTLLRRFFGGARWYEAHSSHAYQHASRQWGSHRKVTLAVAALNIGWLTPLAWTSSVWPELAPLLTVVALAPLIWIAFHFRAGEVGDRWQ